MVMTSVAGHLLELDFVPPYNKWYGCEARQLYDAAVIKSVNQVRYWRGLLAHGYGVRLQPRDHESCAEAGL